MSFIMQAALQSAAAYDCLLSSGIHVGTNMKHGVGKLVTTLHQNDKKHLVHSPLLNLYKIYQKVGTDPSSYMRPIHKTQYATTNPPMLSI